MKKEFKKVALFLVLGMATASCQKDDVFPKKEKKMLKV